MSGHSKWSKIKHQKAAGDAKKGRIFSKISRLISLAAKKGGDPETNLVLRYAITQAREANMPADNVERAIKKGTGELQGERLEEVMYEAFGPGGSAILITCITDNKNRTCNEIKHLLTAAGAKLGNPGSASWAFQKQADNTWQTKQPIQLSKEDSGKLKALMESLEEQDDVQNIYTNAPL